MYSKLYTTELCQLSCPIPLTFCKENDRQRETERRILTHSASSHRDLQGGDSRSHRYRVGSLRRLYHGDYTTENVEGSVVMSVVRLMDGLNYSIMGL